MASRESEAARIFLEAVENHQRGQWADFVQEASAGDPVLLERVGALLRAHDESNPMLDAARLLADADIHRPSECPGMVIGPYKLLEQIGEGGMGVVFMAEQSQPLRRRVALKVIKPGMDTKQVIARFGAERQALALMDHPNIARVLDAGTTDSGRPYFVMELVKGIPVTEYCDQARLTPCRRLDLFHRVCLAVQHAHQKGIIHRDLKPSNVLVTLQDGEPVPKVIDFGIAKATGEQLTDRTLFTGFAQTVGTPLYMSPEQAALSATDVDTRSDVYSLGVLLYELLTGTTPFENETLSRAGHDEMRRIIREDEPPKPSTRLGTLEKGALSTLAERRGVDSRQLSSEVRGELDWMVLKALEKDRNCRYESASAFAADVQRYLNDEPVQACPPSALYRFQKLARRNKAALVTAGLVVVALALGTALSMWQAIRATRAERLAEARLEAEEQARREAQAGFQTARQAVDRFTRVAEDMADQPHMEEIRGRLLEDALQFYEGFLSQKSGDPAMRHATARAYMRVGTISEMLGRAENAEKALRQAVTLLGKLSAEFPSVCEYRDDLVASHGSVAFRLRFANRPEEWIDERRTVLALSEKMVTDFPTSPAYVRRLAYCHTNLGNALAHAQPKEAEKHYRQALTIWEKLRTDFPHEAEDRFGISHSHHWLGAFLLDSGRFPEAELELRQAMSLREKLLAESPGARGIQAHLAHVKSYVGNLLYSTGEPQKAERYYRQAVQIDENLRDDFPHTTEYQRRLGIEYGALGQALLALGRTQEAEEALRKRLAIQMKLATDHPSVEPYPAFLGWSHYDLGLLLHASNRDQEAAEAFRQALRIFESLAAEFPNAPHRQADLAWLMCACPAPQFRNADRAVEVTKKALQHEPLSADYWRTLGLAEYRAGKWQAALDALEKSRELDGSRDNREPFFLAMAHWQQGDKKQARKWYDQAVQWMDKKRQGDLELRHFRAEAAALLRREEKK